MFGCTFSVEKVGPNKLRCPAKGKPIHNTKRASPMCNRVSKPNHTAASWRLRRILTFAVPDLFAAFSMEKVRLTNLRCPANGFPPAVHGRPEKARWPLKVE